MDVTLLGAAMNGLPPDRAGGLEAAVRAGLLRPGLVLTARVAGIQPDGLAVLDFGRFRAQAEAAPHWRPGDVLRFQVGSQVAAGGARLPFPVPSAPPGIPLPLRLFLHPLEALGRRPSLERLPPDGVMAPPSARADSHPSATPAHAGAQWAPARPAPTWRSLVENLLGWMSRSAGGDKPSGGAPPPAPERGPAERGVDAPGPRTAAGETERVVRGEAPAWPTSCRWDDGQVMVKVFRRPAAGGGDGARARASILAVTTHLGAVRVDLALSGQGMSVAFFVAQEACAGRLREGLGALRAALEDHGPQVQIKVRVSPSRIEAFLRSAAGLRRGAHSGPGGVQA